MDIQWIYVVLAALVGGGAGFYFGRNSQPDMKIRAELEARAQAADEKHADCPIKSRHISLRPLDSLTN